MQMQVHIRAHMYVHVRADADADAHADVDMDVGMDVDADVDVVVDVDVGRRTSENTVAARTGPRMRRHMLDGRWKIYCHYQEDQDHRHLALPPEPPISMLATTLRA